MSHSLPEENVKSAIAKLYSSRHKSMEREQIVNFFKTKNEALSPMDMTEAEQDFLSECYEKINSNVYLVSCVEEEEEENDYPFLKL